MKRLNKSTAHVAKVSTGGFDKSVLEQRGLITTGFHLPYNPTLKEAARRLRKNPTPSEKKIWYGYLRNFEHPVLRQRPIDNYIVDFYCPEYRLIVEIDGDSHFTDDGKVYDEERTKILEQYGLRVLRFTNEDVLQNLEGVIGGIEEAIEYLRNTPSVESRNVTRAPDTNHIWTVEEIVKLVN